jgi:hypothetical protein
MKKEGRGGKREEKKKKKKGREGRGRGMEAQYLSGGRTFGGRLCPSLAYTGWAIPPLGAVVD